MRGILWAIAVAVLTGTLFSSCEEEKKYYVPNVGNGEETPTMSTIDVRTFISDSGYTKYFITTPKWDMYDEAREPFWKFPQGVELEQYNNKQKIESTLRCDSAKYLSQRRVWQLDGNVVMVNVARDTFLTNQVFWDQARHKLYSDSFIHIVKTDRVIEGYGFESDESMNSYTVQKPMGIFPVNKQDDKEGTSSPAPDTEATGDRDTRLAPAPQRASERNNDNNGLLMFNPNRTK